MMKKSIKIILSILLVSFTVNASKNEIPYTPEQIDIARIKSVAQAKNGNIDSALHRLKVLSKYDSYNTKIWYDYLAVLYWGGQIDNFFVILKSIHSTNIANYFLDTCLAVIKSLKSFNKHEHSIQLFSFLIKSPDFLESHFLTKMYKASKISNTDNNYINLLNQSSVDPKYLKKVNLYQLTQMSREGDIDKSVDIFDAEKFNSEKELYSQKPSLKTQKTLKEQEQEKFKKLKQKTFLDLSIQDIENILIQQPYSTKYFNRWNDLAKELGYFKNDNKIDFYRKSLARHPQNSLFNYNYLVLLSWNQQHQEALSLFKLLAPQFDQSYYYKALANSAKQTKDYQLALSLYDKALNLEKVNTLDSIVAKANVLQELRQPRKAIDLLDQVDNLLRQDIDYLYSIAGAYRQIGNSIFAIGFYDEILKANPNSDRALLNKAITLTEAHLPFYAFEILQTHPDLFSFEQILEIYSGMNTFKVKLTSDDSNHEEQQIAVDDAMKINSEYINHLTQFTKHSSKFLYAVSDRAILLHLKKDYKAVIEIYQNNLKTLPNYALNVASSSALALKSPKLALEISQKALLNNPSDFNALTNAYYASLELENFSTAFKYLNKIDKQSSIWLYSSDGKRSIENPVKKSVLLSKSMHISFTNNLGEAQVEFENLLNKAPLNSDYRVSLAQIYHYRGWYEKAQEQLNIVNNSDPEFIKLKIAQISLLLDKKEYKTSEQQINELLVVTPLPEYIQRLNKEWTIHNSNILSISYAKTDTDGSTFSSKDKTYSASLHSQPIFYNWRIFGFQKDVYSEFFSIEDHIESYGLGVNYRQTWGETNFSLYNIDGKSGQEFSMDGTWKINDYYSASAQYQSFSDNTPVRAFRSDIYTESFNIGLTYSPNEEYQYQGKMEFTDFTDGNQRSNIALNAYQPLYRDEHHILSIWEYVYAQYNTLDTNREYFNPESLYSLSAALDYTGIVSRKYDNSFTHSARLGFGYSKQDNFSAKPFIDISYLHRWDVSRYFQLYYGIGFRKKYYDGIQEKGPNFKAGLEYKF